jgi:hypothetical protein
VRLEMPGSAQTCNCPSDTSSDPTIFAWEWDAL